MTKIDYRKRAERGAAWLDKRQPDWFRPHKVALGKLSMSSNCFCILGQVYGTYYEVLDGDIDGRRRSADWAARHGFTLGGEGELFDDSAWDELHSAWVDLIRERRAS